MSLRLRLVLWLGAMLAAGLAVAGVLTYSFYAPSQYAALDAQLGASQPLVTARLEQLAGIAPAAEPGAGGPGAPGGSGGPGAGHGPGGGNGPRGPQGSPPVEVPLGTYGVLLSSSGSVLAHVVYGTATSLQPKLPDPLPPTRTGPVLLTTASTTGSAAWRLRLAGVPSAPGDVVAVAFPVASLQSSLDRLIVVELAVAVALLLVLTVISWLILRTGLRPLEEMATTAHAITGGDLSVRVGLEQGAREVVELGTALDRMLDEIETAFAARDATEKRLRQFLADASHELRTPLTSIQGFAELFRLGMHGEHVDQATIARRIEQEAARMRRLVEDLLLLARLDQSPSPARAPVDLAVLAADACSDAVAAAPDRRVTLTAPEPVVVEGDEGHLRQALANLVTNAVRHTPAGTAIDVAARREDGAAAVEVRDHGEGLDAEALAHGFDRFWQADPSRAGAGAGLGLPIVAAVAAEHGGTAQAANATGGGAVFTLRIPLAGDGSAGEQAEGDAVPQRPPRRFGGFPEPSASASGACSHSKIPERGHSRRPSASRRRRPSRSWTSSCRCSTRSAAWRRASAGCGPTSTRTCPSRRS